MKPDEENLIFKGEVPPLGTGEAFDFFTEEMEYAFIKRPMDFRGDEYTIEDLASGVFMWIGNGEDSMTVGRWPNVESARERGRAGIPIPSSFRKRLWKAYLRWKDRWTKGGSYDRNERVIRAAMSLRLANHPTEYDT